MSGPPDKWTKFEVTPDMTSDQVLDKLNDLAKQGYLGPTVSLGTDDGIFVYVGGYSEQDS